MQRQAQESEFKERLVTVNRVSKTVKGGKNFRFSALVVVGDEKGRVGVGMGKAVEITEAIRKGTEDAKKHLVNVPLVGTSIPHESKAGFSTSKEDENFEYIWVRFVQFETERPEWLADKTPIDVKGTLELCVYNDKLEIGCRVNELKPWEKEQQQ